MTTGKKQYYGHRQRLRQKFRRAGLSGFHDYEALELLLAFAIPRSDVKPAAKEMLKRFGGLRGALDAPASELQSIPGIGGNASHIVALVRELSAALLGEASAPAPALSSPADVAGFVGPLIASDEGENLYALYLNSKNRPIGLDAIYEGSPDVAGLPRRLVMEKAIERNARSIIFVHRMASLTAAEDSPARPLAMALRSLASAVDIIVHDYIIMAGGGVMSAREKGWLKG